MTKTTILGLVLAGALAACSSEQEMENGGQGRNKVLLTVSNGTQTRASDGLYTATTGFDGSESVTVWLKGATGEPQQAVYSVGAADAGTHKSALTYTSGTELEYPLAGASTLYAVYPATSTEKHVVAHDQRNTKTTTTGDAAYKASDLMYARTVVQENQQTQTHNLAFDHQLAKVKFLVTKDASISQLQGVTVSNVLRRVPVTVTSERMTVGPAEAAQVGDADYNATAATNNSILVGGEEATDATQQTYTYCCVLPAQSWQNTDFLTIVADGQTVAYTLDKTLTAGQEYTVSLTLSANPLNAGVGISDWTINNDELELTERP